MEDKQEEFVATLITPIERKYHSNQVLGLTTKNISFLKKKLISKSGAKIIKYSIDDCMNIIYKDERPLSKIIFGVFVMFVISVAFYMLVFHWNCIEAGSTINIGALVIALFFGIRWTFSSRRHKLIFVLQDRTELIWKSSSGDYKLKINSVQSVIEFARNKGLLRE